jgi:hypothetical protein
VIAGAANAMVALADFDGSAELTAVIEAGEPGTVAGAANSPEVEIVPMLEFPPVTPFTSQVTAELLVPLTFALSV